MPHFVTIALKSSALLLTMLLFSIQSLPAQGQTGTDTTSTSDGINNTVDLGIADSSETFTLDRGAGNAGATADTVTAIRGSAGGGASAQAARGPGQGGGFLNEIGRLFGGQGGFGAGQNAATTRRSIRAPLSLGFSRDEIPNAPTPQVVVQHFEARFLLMPMFQNDARIRVSLQDSTAVLSGNVATAKQKEMAQRLAMFEPGVKTVQNNLVVAEVVN